jgi:hypothetical protein
MILKYTATNCCNGSNVAVKGHQQRGNHLNLPVGACQFHLVLGVQQVLALLVMLEHQQTQMVSLDEYLR